MYNLLFSPIKISKLVLKNRFLMLPMHLCFAKDNKVSERDIEFYRQRAAGGPAAIYVSAAVAKRGLLYRMHLIDSDECVKGLSQLSNVIHENNCRFFIQLFHCGRNGNEKTLSGLKALAPSALPSRIYKEIPEEMAEKDILEAQQQFADAAFRAKTAGADGVEISVSVGYLLCEFLSPITNLRTDDYGGSEENRFRFPLEVFRKVRAAVGPDFPVMMRLSAAQMVADGYDVDFVIRLCKALEAENLLDMVSVTGGWHEAPLPLIVYHVPPAGYAYMADTIHREIKSPILVSTRINDGATAEQMIKDGIAELVGMARPFLTDPNIVNKIHEGKPFNKCLGCSRGCNERIYIPEDATCVLNPEVGKEYLDIKRPKNEENKNKKMLVVGAGPAGLYAAVKAARRGYQVTLASEEEKLGGTLNIAAVPPRKQDLLCFIKNKEYELMEQGVEVILNTRVDSAFIQHFRPDYVAIAVGGTTFITPIPGIERENVFLAADVLKADGALLRHLKAGKAVVIGGGSVGLETAIFLSEKGMGGPQAVDFYFNTVAPANLPAVQKFVDITIIEMTGKIGTDLGSLRRFVVPDAERLQIKMLTNTKVIEIVNHNIIVETEKGRNELPYDNVILAVGVRSYEPEFIQVLEQMKIPFVKLGNAEKPGSAMDATHSAFEWSLTI